MFTRGVVINCNKNSDFSYTLIVGVDYPECLQPLHKGLKDELILKTWIKVHRAINFR